jgi:MYXO-CTERM domain-containing protein
MRTAKAAILSAVMAMVVPGEALAGALLDHSISPAPEAIHSLSCGDAARFHFASHPATGPETTRTAATPNAAPETPNAAAQPKRGRGTYGMALAGLALLGFVARRRHRVLNGTA